MVDYCQKNVFKGHCVAVWGTGVSVKLASPKSGHLGSNGWPHFALQHLRQCQSVCTLHVN